MTNDKNDRDATIDRLLAGTMARGSAEPEGACLDADTLAAWADDGLDTGERAAAEAHAAGCARCQAMLAAMVKTRPPAEAVASVWRMPALRWLIPLTAAAAAVIVWMVVPLSDMRQPDVREVSQIAEAPPPPAAVSSAADAVAPSDAPLATSRLSRRQETPGQAKDKEAGADKKPAAAPNANAIVNAPARSADALFEKVQVPAEPNARAAAPPASAAPAFALRAPEAVIVSSNPASRWRIVTGGAVQRSADGGATWEMQNTGVSDTLSAGSSPSRSVCWLVGPSGIVLLSTDGRTWKRVPFPEAVPLVAVRATDEQTTTVTTADGRQFATENGGRTWQLR